MREIEVLLSIVVIVLVMVVGCLIVGVKREETIVGGK